MSYRDTMIREHRTSKHDEIVAWLDDNVDRVLAELGIDEDPVSTTWEWPIHDDPWGQSSNPSVLGFVDLMVRVGDGLDILRIGFEVKPEIDCLGDVIRQLRFYALKTGTDKDRSDRGFRWVVVSPDDRHAERIRTQGFEFLHWKPDA